MTNSDRTNMVTKTGYDWLMIISEIEEEIVYTDDPDLLKELADYINRCIPYDAGEDEEDEHGNLPVYVVMLSSAEVALINEVMKEVN